MCEVWYENVVCDTIHSPSGEKEADEGLKDLFHPDEISGAF